MPRERRRTPRHQLGRVAAILCGPGEERSCLVKDFSDGGVRLQLNGVIQMSLIDTWAATGAGAFTLTENGLYTVEAWRRFLGRLNADGLFTVSLAVATLLTNGAAEPRRHLFLAAAGKVATLIVAKSPFSPAALAALKDAAKANEFTVLLGPDTAAPSAMLGAGVLAASVALVTSIAFSIDTTLRIGAACYLLVAAPAVLLASARSRPSSTATIPAP